MSDRNGSGGGFDPTAQGNPSPSPDQFFGLDAGNESTGAVGHPDDTQPEPTLQHGQLDGLSDWGTSEHDVTDAGVPGGHPQAQAQGGSVDVTQPGSWLSRDGYQTVSVPQNSPEPTTWGDPTNDGGFFDFPDSFGSIDEAQGAGGHALSYDDSGAGHGSAGTERV